MCSLFWVSAKTRAAAFFTSWSRAKEDQFKITVRLKTRVCTDDSVHYGQQVTSQRLSTWAKHHHFRVFCQHFNKLKTFGLVLVMEKIVLLGCTESLASIQHQDESKRLIHWIRFQSKFSFRWAIRVSWSVTGNDPQQLTADTQLNCGVNKSFQWKSELSDSV